MINIIEKVVLINANPEIYVGLDTNFTDIYTGKVMKVRDVIDENTVIYIKRRIMTGGRGNHELVKFVYTKEGTLEESNEIIPIAHGNVVQLVMITNFLRGRYEEDQIIFIDSYETNLDTMSHLNYKIVGLVKDNRN